VDLVIHKPGGKRKIGLLAGKFTAPDNISDIDIALKGSGINLQVLNSISRDVDDLLIPNAVDLCIYDRIDDPDFLEHINRVGKVLYLRDGTVESI
jgi:hypothetical protein